ncbi:MAG TPA: ABC transporter permease [Cerasibacillus sp.]|uniref:ABC transporter permease n=1 Tax=Cerasibacillus sp. TaxID=2498711 RepID=UPI002F40DF57
MRNALKVARWEIRRNLKNKTYLIGLFITPALILLFGFLGSLMGEDAEISSSATVFINDEVGVYDALKETVDAQELDWEVQQTDLAQDQVDEALEDTEDTAYIFINQEALSEGIVPVYTSDTIYDLFTTELMVLESPLKSIQMAALGLSKEQLAKVATPIMFSEEIAGEDVDNKEATDDESGALEEDPFKQVVPGIFAGIILFSIVVAGMYIFQSASQEKKDKIAEIILSSVTPGELMQGKIIGYFVLGLLQAVVLLAFAIPVALWKTDIPIIEYLLVPETLLLVFIAVIGYLLFAALYVGIGATMADVSTAGNFQGLVLMLPFLPFIFATSVFMDPTGIVAKVGTYFPFTSPGVLLMRLTVMEEWPWVEIGIALAILVISTAVMMKLAGKIFKVGILMYGKNASLKEMWKWLRA